MDGMGKVSIQGLPKTVALLQAASVLASQGREASARVLRKTFTLERVALATLGQRPKLTPTMEKPRSSEIRVAAILDEFSANSFDRGFQTVHLDPASWRAQFEEIRPQVFFCESAWSGRDSQMRPWKGQIYASSNFQYENRQKLLEILAHCRAAGIPTVFWNKEDPTHYPDRVHDFVKTAAAFDHVFTTALECVPLYGAQYGLQSVHALPFATNPAMFNPIDSAPRSDTLIFAGSWYANHVERSRDMHQILRSLRLAGYEVEIYDRYHDDSDPLHRWPSEYQPFVHPAVPHDQISTVYKRSRLALNINTVTDSRTMFARRVFELMSSNTLVLSNYSMGMAEMFGEDVIFCDRDLDRLKSMSSAEIDEMRARNLNRVLSAHTYRNRWEDILRVIGLPFRPAAEALTIVWPLHSAAEADRALNWFQQEADLSQDRLLLVALAEMDPIETATLYESHNRLGVTVTSLTHAEDLSLKGRYAPIETEHAALIDVNAPPSPGWLASGRLHLQYAGKHPISPRAAREAATFLIDIGRSLDSQNMGKVIYV